MSVKHGILLDKLRYTPSADKLTCFKLMIASCQTSFITLILTS